MQYASVERFAKVIIFNNSIIIISIFWHNIYTHKISSFGLSVNIKNYSLLSKKTHKIQFG